VSCSATPYGGRRFGADPAIVGQSVLVDGGEFDRSSGFMPPGFDFPMAAELWAPLAFDSKMGGEPELAFPDAARPPRAGRTIEEAQPNCR